MDFKEGPLYSPPYSHHHHHHPPFRHHQQQQSGATVVSSLNVQEAQTILTINFENDPNAQHNHITFIIDCVE